MRKYIAILAALLLVIAIYFYCISGENLHLLVTKDDVAAVRRMSLSKADATREIFYAQSAEMTELLFSKGANVNAENAYGCNPIHFAAGAHLHPVLQTLLALGANATARDRAHQATALHWLGEPDFTPEAEFERAASGSSVSASRSFQLLVANGADISAVDYAGQTPLFYAARSSPEVCKLLLDSGANVNARAVVGTTPLHEAVRCDNTECVRLLLNFGANQRIIDSNGRTPADFVMRSNPVVRRLLQK